MGLNLGGRTSGKIPWKYLSLKKGKKKNSFSFSNFCIASDVLEKEKKI